MIIKGNTVGTPTPRTNYNQTDPSKADYLKGKNDLDENIKKAKTAADNAQTAVNKAQTAADNAKTAADNAKTAADNAQTTANNAMTAAGDAQTAADNVLNQAKSYCDAKHKILTATITTNDWTGNAAPYTQTIGVEGILETDRPHVMPVYSETLETALLEKEAWAMVSDANTANGSITFICFEDKPAVAIPVQIEVNR